MATHTLNKCVFIRGKEARDAMADALFEGDAVVWMRDMMQFNRFAPLMCVCVCVCVNMP